MTDLRPNRIFAYHCLIIAILVVGHVAGLFTLMGAGPSADKFFNQYLDLDSEGAPAAYFSALGFLAAALVAAHLSRHEETRARRVFWATSALFLLFVSFDEAASIHEGFQVIANVFLPREGIFYFSWWAPYLVALAPVLAALAPGLLTLPAATRNTLFFAGAIFLVGVLGFELMESSLFDTILSLPPASAEATALTRRFGLLALGEETLEMAAVAVLLRALLRHAAAVAPEARIRIGDAQPGCKAAARAGLEPRRTAS